MLREFFKELLAARSNLHVHDEILSLRSNGQLDIEISLLFKRKVDKGFIQVKD